jgi:hypothetical protein
LTVGVTAGTDSGISIVTTVVGEPSQPCGTLNVTTLDDPAAVEVALALTWALAAAAGARASRVPAPSASATAPKDFVDLMEWVLSQRKVARRTG